jgi:hypothetical protein
MSGNTTWFGVQYPSSSDYVKDGATAIQTVADGFDSAVAIPTYNAQTGTTYTFVLADTSKTVTASNAAASTYTIPPQSSVVWVSDTTLSVTNLGAGVVTFAGGSGVTVTNTANTLSQYQSAQLIRTGSDAWTVVPTSGIASSPGSTFISATTIGSAVSSVTVTGLFSGTYDAYKIVISGGTGSANTSIRTQLRNGGTTETGSFYKFASTGSQYADGVYAKDWSAGFTTNFTYTGYVNNTDAYLTYNVDLINPFLGKPTLISGQYAHLLSNRSMAGYLDTTTSYDGLVISPETGTLTGGTIRVYGYQN